MNTNIFYAKDKYQKTNHDDDSAPDSTKHDSHHFQPNRCAVPGVDNDTWESQGPEHDQVVSQVIPTDLTSNTWSRCLVRRYSDPDFPHLSNDTVECSRWVYSKETFEATLTSEVNSSH